MGQLPDLQATRLRLGLALDSLCHDRWILGYLRRGWLQPIAASDVMRRSLQSRPLEPLARRALYEKKPIAVNSVLADNRPSSNGFDWQQDWPAILYAPVQQPGKRPIGLLVLGCRKDHWYTDDDIGYAQSLGLTLAPMVLALRGPLSRLDDQEGEVAQLLSYGFSTLEVAQAIGIDERLGRCLVDSVCRKLRSSGADKLAFPDAERRAARP